jgi:hypothetical protein
MNMHEVLIALMDLLIKFLLIVIPPVVVGVIIPWLTAHTTKIQQAEITRMVETLVQTAEQLLGPGTGPDKLAAVQKWLEEKGIDVDVNDIEAAVLRLHAAGHDWLAAHSQDANAIPSTNTPAMAKAANNG